MRIAIPVAGGRLATHFGHCESFVLLDVAVDRQTIAARRDLAAPPHQPGLLPAWLAERGATLIIAGGMGQRARSLFASHGIEVLVGAPPETPETLAAAYLIGSLRTGENACDH
jgi:predicted Fe-Mo cluster-binding NifX family protein